MSSAIVQESPPSTASTKDSRLPQIQGLRALAVVLVIAYHAGLPIRGGYMGVDVFFVISGFVITRLIMQRQREAGAVGFADFYRRRIRRLLPALALMVSFTVVVSMLVVSPVGGQSDTAITGIGASFWLANLALYYVTSGYFAPNSHFAVLLHTWSLGVEEQFYLVFPAILGVGFWVAIRKGPRRRYPRTLATVLIGSVLLISFLINIWLCYKAPITIPAPQGIAFFFPFSRAWEFGAGALVAVWCRRDRSMPSYLRESLAACGLFAVLAAALTIPDTVVFPGYIALLPVVATVCLIAGIQGEPTAIGRWLSRPGPEKVGDLSYSLYLWHWPFVAFAVTLWGQSWILQTVAVVISLPVAWASFVYVERPIRERRRATGSTRRLLATSLSIPVALSAVLFVGGSAAWGIPGIQNIQRQTAPKTLNGKHCQTLVKFTARSYGSCTFRGPSGLPPVILMGDSNAAMYADGLVLAGEQTGRTVILATMPGCPMVLAEVYTSLGSGQCLPLVRSALAWIDSQPHALVVLASANTVVDDGVYTLQDPSTGLRSSNAAMKARIWQDGLQRVMAAIKAHGDQVVQIRAIPHFFEGTSSVPWTPEECSFPSLIFNLSGCGPTQSLAAGSARHRLGLQAEASAARAEGVKDVDFGSEVCPDGICRTHQGSFWVYREGMHLSVGMSKRLAPQLAAIIGGAP